MGSQRLKRQLKIQYSTALIDQRLCPGGRWQLPFRVEGLIWGCIDDAESKSFEQFFRLTLSGKNAANLGANPLARRKNPSIDNGRAVREVGAMRIPAGIGIDGRTLECDWSMLAECDRISLVASQVGIATQRLFVMLHQCLDLLIG